MAQTKPTLFPHQVEGVAFLEKLHGRALICDEMGLGKTAQVLTWLNDNGGVRPVVVVCPTSVRGHWQNEIERWVDEEAYLPMGATATGDGYWGQPFVVIHYSIVSQWCDWLAKLKPKAVVIDEAHLIKTSSAARTKAVKQLCKGVKHVVGLTGTPIVNRPIEAFNILRLVGGKAIPDWWHYTRRYCDAKHNGFGWDFTGASNTDELHKLLIKTVMLRRRKVDVMQSLPPKIRQFVPLTLGNRKEYDEARGDFLSYLSRVEGDAAARRASRAQAITKVNKLRAIAAAGKLTEALSWIEDVIEGGNKLVVFAVHRTVLDTVYTKFKKIAVRLDGSTPQADRGKVISRFQENPKCRLFVGQIHAAGVGITLTAASHLAFLELPWTPGDVLQAEDRCHRIGQASTVNIYYLMASGTIDEVMGRLIDQKRETLDQLLDGVPDASPSILTDLLNEYRLENLPHTAKI